MPENQTWLLRDVTFALLAVAFMLFVYGAVPFLMLPTLGQVIWATGFSQSLANGPLFNFYVNDFGIPTPAAIAFGLAGAWPASLLIRLGLPSADAYAGMVAIWLSLAMFSAYRIVRLLGATRSISLLGAVTWMSMPIIWVHAGYSMLSLGIALLSFYFMMALKLFLIGSESTQITLMTMILYCVAAIVAVFMDGYTFMMFAIGASILLMYSLITRPEIRWVLIKTAIPIHIAGFALAYFLFSAYSGQLNFETHPIDFFRGWGLDLSFLVIPTAESLWIPDLLGISLERTDELYFGDGTVWQTTFALPILMLGLMAWLQIRRKMKASTGVLLVVLFGFYMALGPSLKINSTKPEFLQINYPRQQSALMPDEYALLPTGNAWISEKLPGFSAMRASYRWSALGLFALWLLVMMAVSRKGKQTSRIWLLGLFVVILFNVPDFQKRWQGGMDYRAMFQQIDRELITELRHYIQPDETVVFIPWGNDFFANYLAPKAGFRTFNIGGDKNLAAAQTGWPRELFTLGGKIEDSQTIMASKILVDNITDVLVIPYFHMLWAPHLWPCVQATARSITEAQKAIMRKIPGFVCPDEQRTRLKPMVEALRAFDYLEVLETPLFATVRLRPEFSGEVNRLAVIHSIFDDIRYPIKPGEHPTVTPYLLADGWYPPETHHVWSQAAATLKLPVPNDCEPDQCEAVLQLVVFAASPHRPVHVSLSMTAPGVAWEKSLSTTMHALKVNVPLNGQNINVQEISISVPEATSPVALGFSEDPRILGIALERIDLIRK